MGLQLSWLERTPDKGEVDGPIPFRPTITFRVKQEIGIEENQCLLPDLLNVNQSSLKT